MNRKNILKFVGIFFLYYLSDLIYLIPLLALGIDVPSLSLAWQMFLMILADLFVTIILGLIYKNYLIEKFHDFKHNFLKYFDMGLKYWLIGLSFMYLSNSLLAIFSPVKEAINESNVQSLITASPFLAMLLTTIFAPINEEIIFRKSIQDCLKNKWVFIVVSGLIFGYLHVLGSESLYDFLYIIPYGSLGATFAYLLSKTDNIYVTILMHLIHNGLLTIISILL